MKKKLFRTHAFITGIVLIGFICITIINYCTYSVVIRDDIRNISRLTSLNIFSSISNELTKPIFVSLTMANDSFLKSWLRGENEFSGTNCGTARLPQRPEEEIRLQFGVPCFGKDKYLLSL